ncbi:WD repeat protein 82 [Reticulomyxa filosa]|uniref:WD repeat protein 82 n=1 Tax=Reticulomyxa filosa TaxID=46433 RepID=X6P1G8_RETFI|nr:WD repeat protein 82 [Reticulomyxa filosa]|eukprot:ETO32370.1 WD repeat protein 82 [Reticulomyxa filosa]
MAQPNKTKSVILNENVIKAFGMSKVFRNLPTVGTSTNNKSKEKEKQSTSGNEELRITGMDIDNSGQYIVTCDNDNCIKFYDCLIPKRKQKKKKKEKQNRLQKTVYVKNFGVECIQFTHHNKCILMGCTKDHAIRYHSLHDNVYLRTFSGHTEKITHVNMHPLSDQFMSCSFDKSIRFWDLRTSDCIAKLEVPQRPTCAYDREGLVFAIGTGKNELKLYDSRQYGSGPFQTFSDFPTEPSHGRGDNAHNHNGHGANENDKSHSTNIPGTQRYEWSNLEFSPNGKQILISTRTNMLILVDAFEGNVIRTLESFDNSENKDSYGIFTPDNSFVCVPENGDIHFWDLNKYRDIIWRGHPKKIERFLFNPKYCMAVSAAQHVAIWLPDAKKVQPQVQNKDGTTNENMSVIKSSLKGKGKD